MPTNSSAITVVLRQRLTHLVPTDVQVISNALLAPAVALQAVDALAARFTEPQDHAQQGDQWHQQHPQQGGDGHG